MEGFQGCRRVTGADDANPGECLLVLQVITGSHDKTVKLWDLRKGKAMTTLTYHKKSVRGLALHPTEYCFASASAENIKKFRLPRVSLPPPPPPRQAPKCIQVSGSVLAPLLPLRLPCAGCAEMEPKSVQS